MRKVPATFSLVAGKEIEYQVVMGFAHTGQLAVSTGSLRCLVDTDEIGWSYCGMSSTGDEVEFLFQQGLATTDRPETVYVEGDTGPISVVLVGLTPAGEELWRYLESWDWDTPEGGG